MVFMLNESTARVIFKKYNAENVAAFTLGKTKGISEDNLEISYRKLSIIPDNDTVNAVINGDIKAKKVIKAAVKALHNPLDPENQAICTNMCMIANIIDPMKARKKKKAMIPNIVVFVYDDELDEFGKARIKFLKKYLSALFGEFGLKVFTVEDKKDLKGFNKIFDKKKRKKVIKKVSEFKMSADGARVSRKGHTLEKILMQFFAVEMHQAALNNLKPDDLGGNLTKNLVCDLLYVFTNDNLKVSADVEGKKNQKALCKTLRKKNRMAVEAYNSLSEILQNMDPKEKSLPEVKNGYKKGKDKPKMNIKKFEKFFNKGKNAVYLILAYAHISCVLLGVEIGSSEYNKIISSVLRDTSIDSKDFIAAAKTYAKK